MRVWSAEKWKDGYSIIRLGEARAEHDKREIRNIYPLLNTPRSLNSELPLECQYQRAGTWGKEGFVYR